jgi:hypothetical protein
MSIFNFISNIFKPAVDLVDELHTSEEEKLTMERELRKVENAFSTKILDYEGQLLQSRSAIIQSESTGRSWLQRNWRPITMLTFLILVVCDSFGLLTFRLSDEAWMLLQIGLGGYVVGRSAEKIIPGLFKKLKPGAVG